MSTAAKPKAHKVKLSGYTYKETYDLYNQQLHYARSHYTTAQLNAWQTDWNKYFTKYGMEIPAYAHKIEAKKGKSGKAQFAASGNERSTAAVRGSTAPHTLDASIQSCTSGTGTSQIRHDRSQVQQIEARLRWV